MIETIVSLETARLLKEKGYRDELCRHSQSSAQQWLRDEKMLVLIIDVDFTELECYYCSIYDKTRVLQEQTKNCITYEEALEEGLKQALKLNITICTSNGGKPVDSNYITEWKDIEPITVEVKLEKVSDDGYDWRLRNFRDNHAAYLLDESGNTVTYRHWNYVVPISKFNFEDLQSNIFNALQ